MSTTTSLQELPHLLTQDALTLLCGRLLGFGISRQTYVCQINPKWVVKLQTDGEGRFQNQREWWLWNQFKEAPKDRVWLAPCIAISDLGSWLIMERTTPASAHELRRLVRRVPKYFTDLKTDNWGTLKGGKHVVCHDYGTALAEVSTGSKIAKWWD